MPDPAILEAHKRSIFHRSEIEQSLVCGCFYCLEIFAPVEISDWADQGNPRGETALCPKCGIDSVIGSESGFPIEKEFLQAMRRHWF